MTPDQLRDLGKRVIDIQVEALEHLSKSLDDSFSDAVNALLQCINNRGKIVVVGIGKSGNIGHKIAATLNSTGSTAVVLNSQNALHGDLGIISDGIAFSWGAVFETEHDACFTLILDTLTLLEVGCDYGCHDNVML